MYWATRGFSCENCAMSNCSCFLVISVYFYLFLLSMVYYVLVLNNVFKGPLIPERTYVEKL